MKKIMFVAAALALLVTSSGAQATPLPPGATVPVIPIVPAETGTQVATTGTLAFNETNPFTGQTLIGTIKESVFRESPTGFLNFDYQVTVSPASTDAVGRITGASYKPAGLAVDVSQALTGPGFATGTVISTTADRSAGSGATIGFNFVPGVLPGTTSFVQMVSTHNTTFRTGSISVIDSVTVNFKGFAPAPEPASLVLFGGLALGMGGAGLRRWRQRKAVTA